MLLKKCETKGTCLCDRVDGLETSEQNMLKVRARTNRQYYTPGYLNFIGGIQLLFRGCQGFSYE